MHRDASTQNSLNSQFLYLAIDKQCFPCLSFLCFALSCHVFNFASCRATDSWPTGHAYPSRHSVRSPSFPAEGKRRRWCAGIPWKNMEVPLASPAGLGGCKA
ncbi:hypothetical protein FOYG_07695 [Fusarium oxysporum NRRL 32931]|uniref:Uncharacterized protein n=1 Tax=Fusarium oxysporum NRRL 32931 TaxID=660029 RepID=W9I623_FUSOX|nr:hypothetical protein FOYG_07695 [Fusarium oxysporum NRRL 32931]